MKKILIFPAVLACMLATSSAQAALFSDGGFEDVTTTEPAGILTPDSRPWFGSEAVINPDGSINTAEPYVEIVAGEGLNSSYAAALHTKQNPDPYLEQNFDLAHGEETTVSFWARTTGAGTLVVTFNGALLPTPDPTIDAAEYTQYGPYTVGKADTGKLVFSWDSGSGQTMYIDDVSVTQVPEPTTLVAGVLLLLPFGASTLRRLRKRQAA